MATGKPFIVLISLVLLLAIPPVAKGDPGDPEPATPETVGSPLDPVGSTVRPLSLVDLPPERVEGLGPLQTRLRQILLAEHNRLTPLYAEFAEETDSLLSLEIQRRIQQVKVETEISLLRAQADHAHQNGQRELAERIEAGLRRMAERDKARQELPQEQSARSERPSARR